MDPQDRVLAAAAHPPAGDAPVLALLAVVVPAAGLEGPRPAVVVAEVVAVAPRVRSVGPAVLPDVAASRRSSAVKSLIRWRRHRLVASVSSRATAKRCGSPEARH
jgi:hypothetical protein